MTENNKSDSSYRIGIIVGTTPECIHHDCKGWLIDSFSGRYWIQCKDPKHQQDETIKIRLGRHRSNKQE